MSVPPWVIAMCPIVGLLGLLSIAWWFARRGIGAIHRAASYGDVEKMTALLTARPDSVDVPDVVGLTPLQYAACWGQVGAAKKLIQSGADVNLAKSWSPLHYAAAGGQEELAAILLDAGADINTRSKADDTTPLHTATIKKQAAMAQFLIDHGAALDVATKSGWNACHFAAHEGDLQTMQVLLDAGADWHAQNADDKTPLELALANGYKEIVNLAVKHNDAGQ